MKIKVGVAVPGCEDRLYELEAFLKEEQADLYVFPEGFLDTDNLSGALEIIRAHEAYVITGFKDLAGNTRHQVLLIDCGEIKGEYTKCILAKSEQKKGRTAGDKIHCLDTKFGKIGVPICYEIHFPEVARVLRQEEPVLLFNPIGSGMYHELQFDQWNTIAKARAIENEVYVLGCSHFNGGIPIAYAYDPDGQCLLQKKNEHGVFVTEIDTEKSQERVIGYWEDRRPELF